MKHFAVLKAFCQERQVSRVNPLEGPTYVLLVRKNTRKIFGKRFLVVLIILMLFVLFTYASQTLLEKIRFMTTRKTVS